MGKSPASATTRDQLARDLKSGARVTWVGAITNLLLTLVKLAAGIWGHSQALVADALHSLSDMVTDAVVLVGLRLGRRDPDNRHQFGHGRLETMATVVVGLILAGAGVGLGYDAVAAIQGQMERATTWMAPAAAGISILLNEFLYFYTIRVGRRIDSSLLVANAWHHRSDSLSSVAALIGAGAAALNPDWAVLDSVAALVVSLLVLKVALGIIWRSLRELVDTAPPDDDLAAIESCALGIPGVQSVHDLRVRVTGGQWQAELHVVVDGTLPVAEGHRIAKEVESCIVGDIKKMGRIIVHVDPGPTEAKSEPAQ